MTGRDDLKRIIERFEELSSLFPREVDLVEVEEIAREIGEEISRRVRMPEVVTRTLDRVNETVTHAFDVVKSSTRGRLREAVIKSPSDDFGVLMVSDGVTVIDRSYRDLATISEHVESVDAYQAEDGTYVLRIGEVHWTKSFLLTVYVKERITFNNIFAIYDEYIYP